MIKRILFIISITILLLVLPYIISAQEVLQPKIWLEVSQDSKGVSIVDKYSENSFSLVGNESITNYNATIELNDTIAYFVYDSLIYDSVVTVMTIYETDEDTIVGVWEIGTGANKQIWLNSRKVSYQDFDITYRRTTEKSVIINTMLFEYPKKDSNFVYMGKDTLFLGIQGENIAEKNFCEYLYFNGELKYNQQRVLESCLAIKYGALLHKGYLDKNLDTIWHTNGIDSLYSFGVCGIGRDDSFPLFQQKSIIRKDFLTMEVTDSLYDLNYIMLGCNESSNQLSEETFFIDTIKYHPIERKWKIHSHSNGTDHYIRLTYDLQDRFNANSIRMLISTQDSGIYNTNILRPTFVTDTSVEFDSILIVDAQSYFISIAFEGDSIFKDCKTKKYFITKSKNKDDIENNINISLKPNPTNTGEFEVNINQTNKDEIMLVITDSKGQTIFSKEIKEKVLDYTYTNYIQEQGVYFVSVYTNGIKKTVKLFVIK
jgi:hypothetical protein